MQRTTARNAPIVRYWRPDKNDRLIAQPKVAGGRPSPPPARRPTCRRSRLGGTNFLVDGGRRICVIDCLIECQAAPHRSQADRGGREGKMAATRSWNRRRGPNDTEGRAVLGPPVRTGRRPRMPGRPCMRAGRSSARRFEPAVGLRARPPACCRSPVRPGRIRQGCHHRYPFPLPPPHAGRPGGAGPTGAARR